MSSRPVVYVIQHKIRYKLCKKLRLSRLDRMSRSFYSNTILFKEFETIKQIVRPEISRFTVLNFTQKLFTLINSNRTIMYSSNTCVRTKFQQAFIVAYMHIFQHKHVCSFTIRYEDSHTPPGCFNHIIFDRTSSKTLILVPKKLPRGASRLNFTTSIEN